MFCAMCQMPAAAIVANQKSIMGPKKAATLAVPRDCTANSMIRTSTVNGTTYASNAGVTIFNPSIAERTDSAGVIIASP